MAEEIGEALQRVASAAENSNISLEKAASWIATISSITRESASTIGRSLNTVISRYEQIKKTGFNEEDATKLNDVVQALSQVGIVATDSQGQLRDFVDVMDELGAKYNSLSKNEQVYIATVMFGTYQRNRGITLLRNYNDSLKNYETALNSAGTAEQKFAIYQESTRAKFDKFKTTLESLYQNTLNSGFVKFVLELGAGIVNLVDKVGLLTTAFVGLIIYLEFFKKSALIIPIINNIITTIHRLATSMGIAQGAAMSLSTAIGYIAPFAVIGVIYGIVEAIDAVTTSLSEQKEIVQTLSYSLQNLQSEYDKLESNNKRTAEQERYLALLKKEIDLKKQSLAIETKKAVDREFFTTNYSNLGNLTGFESNFYELVDDTGENKIKQNIEVLKQLREELSNITPGEGAAEQYEKINKKIHEIEQSLTDSRKTIHDAIENFNKAEERIPPELQKLADIIDEVIIKEDSSTKATNNNTDAKNKNANATKNQVKNIEQLQETLSKTTSKLKDYNKYLAEINTSNGLSVKSKEEIISKYKEFLPFLNNEVILRELIQKAIKDEENIQSKTYQEMFDNQINLYKTELENSETYFNQIKMGNADLWATLAKAYENDLQNFNNLADAKLATDNWLRQAIGEGWNEMFLTQEDALVALISSIELSGNSINNPIYDKAYKQLNAIRGVLNHIKSEFKTMDFGVINLSDAPTDDIKNSYEKLGKEIVDSLISGYEKELDMLSDEISLLGKIDTNEEKQKQIEIIQEIINVLNEELIAVQNKIPEIQSKISSASGKELEELNSALDTLIKKERTIRIDIIANTEKIEDVVNDTLKEFINLQKQYDEYIVNKRIEGYKVELNALESKKEIEDEIIERQEKQLSLQKAQEQLANAEKEKNVRIYQNGEWQWISDPKEVKSAKEAVEKAQQDLFEFERNISIKRQREIIEKKIQDEQQSFDNHYNNMERLTLDYLNNLKKIYGDKWSEILNIITANINQVQFMQNNLLNSAVLPANVNTTYQSIASPSPSTISSTRSAPKFGQSFIKSYDSGGLAIGKGIMFKDTIEPERVLSPELTKIFDKFVSILPDIPVLKIPNINNIKSNNNPGVLNSYNIHIDKIETQDAESFIDILPSLATQY